MGCGALSEPAHAPRPCADSFLNVWTTQKASYTKRDLLLYALGIGATDLKFAYENDSDFAAFPTYPLW